MHFNCMESVLILTLVEFLIIRYPYKAQLTDSLEISCITICMHRMKNILEIKVDKSKTLSIDQFIGITHAVQRFSRIIYYDFHRGKDGKFKFRNLFILWIAIVVFVIDIIGHIVKLIILIRESKLGTAQKQVAGISVLFYCYAKAFILLINTRNVENLSNDIDGIFPKSLHLQRRFKVHEVAESIQAHYRYLLPYVIFATFAYACTPLIRYSISYKSGSPVTDEFHQHHSWLPFNLRESYQAYPYVYAYETLHTFMTTFLFITWDVIIRTYNKLICMYYDVLNEQFAAMDCRQAADVKRSKQFFQRVYKCIAFHQYILELGYSLNVIFGSGIVLANTIWGLSICFLINLILYAEDNIDKVLFSIIFIIMVYMLNDVSQLGTFLEDTTSHTKTALYGQNWMETNSKQYAQIHLILMQRANFPLLFTGFNSFTINMEHFKNIMVMAYNFFTFLQSMK